METPLSLLRPPRCNESDHRWQICSTKMHFPSTARRGLPLPPPPARNRPPLGLHPVSSLRAPSSLPR